MIQELKTVAVTATAPYLGEDARRPILIFDEFYLHKRFGGQIHVSKDTDSALADIITARIADYRLKQLIPGE